MGLYRQHYASIRMIRAACTAALLFVVGPSEAGLAEPSFAGYFGKFVVAAPPKPTPSVPFLDADDGEHRLSEYRGKVVLVNFWATWCPACIMEMPALDRLQRELGGDGFAVLAVSQDTDGAAGVSRFLESRRLNNVSVFIDDKRSLGRSFDQSLLPTSILLDSEGREVGRLVGPAEWDSPEAVALIRSFMRRGTNDTARARLR